VNDLTSPHTTHCIQKRRVDRLEVFDPVPLHMDDDDAESQFLEIDLEFKSLVDGDENVDASLRLRRELGVPQRTLTSFGNGQDLMVGKGAPDTRINALV
jgi:hypothetical protein